MALEAFYASISGDLDSVRKHMLTDERVLKFVRLFLEDTTYTELCSALCQKDMQGAFRAAHTLKGLARNMGFVALSDAASQLTEALRPDSDGPQISAEEISRLAQEVSSEYSRVVSAAKLAF